MQQAHRVTARIEGKEITIETGKLAKQADGAVVVQSGETVVIVTAVASNQTRDSLDFFPLTVDYREKAAAAGKFPDGYFKREGRPTEKEILTARPVDVRALARDATRAALEGSDGLRARFSLEPSAGTVVTDGERLRGVLVNLIANARESLAAASRSSGEEVEVGARWLDRGGVLLWVADRGPGIRAADLPHVYEPYFTTKRTGTGLGLAISRKVVEALGGAIRIESREGEGTRVEIELPAEAPAATEVR